MGKPGRVQKESVAQLEKLPSTLVLHKMAYSADTRFLRMHGEFASNPLEKWLKILKQGSYQQANVNEKWAFEPLASMWSDKEVTVMENDTESSSDKNPNSDNDDNLATIDDTSDSSSKGQEDGKNKVKASKLQLLLPPKAQVNAKTKVALSHFYRKIHDSNCWLFFVAYQTNQETNVRWHLAQVEWNATDSIQSQQYGIYAVRWWVQHQADKNSCSIAESRFFPKVYKVMADGSVTNQYYLVNPNKVKQMIQQS